MNLLDCRLSSRPVAGSGFSLSLLLFSFLEISFQARLPALRQDRRSPVARPVHVNFWLLHRPAPRETALPRARHHIQGAQTGSPRRDEQLDAGTPTRTERENTGTKKGCRSLQRLSTPFFSFSAFTNIPAALRTKTVVQPGFGPAAPSEDVLGCTARSATSVSSFDFAAAAAFAQPTIRSLPLLPVAGDLQCTFSRRCITIVETPAFPQKERRRRCPCRRWRHTRLLVGASLSRNFVRAPSPPFAPGRPSCQHGPGRAAPNFVQPSKRELQEVWLPGREDGQLAQGRRAGRVPRRRQRLLRRSQVETHHGPSLCFASRLPRKTAQQQGRAQGRHLDAYPHPSRRS